MNKMIIQGDVALRKVGKAPAGSPVKDKVLAWGEVSGHAHVVTGDAEVIEINGQMFVVTGNDGATLEHMKFDTKAKADHLPIELEPNTSYQVILQNEYNPYSDALERVID